MLGITGVVSGAGSGLLLVTAYSSQVLAGFVAARMAGENAALNGGLAGIGLFFATAVFALAAGTDPTVATIVFSLLLASVLGLAGGLLEEWRRIAR
ncbi:MAG: hypothetical protein ACE5GC_06395 [Acidimicrobiia bacterium]